MNATQSLRLRIRNLRQNERGLSTVEYVIILVLIAAVSVSTWTMFGSKLKQWLGSGSDQITGELETGGKNYAPAAGGEGQK